MHFCFFSFYLLPTVSNHTDWRWAPFLSSTPPDPPSSFTVHNGQRQDRDITERPLAISQRPLGTVTALSDQSDPKKDQLHSSGEQTLLSCWHQSQYFITVCCCLEQSLPPGWFHSHALRRPTRLALPHPSANPTFSSSSKASTTILF